MVIWDNTKPNGQPRRVLNIDKAEQYFGFKNKIVLTDNLDKTIKWYLKDGI